jgi:lipopolysaccharide/colanic/teichoic acid biosynthesis glycosyltransferase
MSAGLPEKLEAGVALAGLAMAAPLLAACAAAVKLSSKGPILFRQKRVGKGGAPFVLYKFRTMTTGGAGASVTSRGDKRITRVGAILRRTKLDELPELWNVINGTMSLVGPRPEVESLVDLRDPLWQSVLEAKPGITSPTAIELHDEEAVLSQVPEDARERFYAEALLPYKLRSQAEYLRTRTAWTDLAVLAKTALAIAARPSNAQPSAHEIERAVEVSGDPHSGAFGPSDLHERDVRSGSSTRIDATTR